MRTHNDEAVGFIVYELIIAIILVAFCYAVFSYGFQEVIDMIFGGIGDGINMSAATYKYFQVWGYGWENLTILGAILLVGGAIIIAIVVRAYSRR
jgi:hypothetical protein